MKERMNKWAIDVEMNCCVGWSVGPSGRPSITFLNSEPFSPYCSYQTVCNWIAVYPVLFLTLFESSKASDVVLVNLFSTSCGKMVEKKKYFWKGKEIKIVLNRCSFLVAET